MKKHSGITIKRLHRFLERLKSNYYYDNVALKATYHKTAEPISWDAASDVTFEPIEVGTHWGSQFECAWFRFQGQVPQSFKGKYVVALIDIGGEACRFDDQGNPVQGLTNKKISWTLTETIIKKRIKLFEAAEGGEEVDILIDAGANNILGTKNVLTYESMVDGVFNQADIAVFDHEKWQLRIDFELLLQIALELPEHSRHRRLIVYALNEVCNRFGEGTPKEVGLCRSLLQPELRKPANASALKVSAIGHAHIDIAWLWPLRETIRKTSRTFSTALRMMEYYPEYKFGASQPALYQMIKDHYPGLYDRVKTAIKNGTWECQGAMYVEADCNLASGESLVRQVIFGKRFFKEEFDVEVDNLWLPDVFGYSAALPQILKKADVDYFMTQKISWNQFNSFPYHTFWWEGIDGTRIYSHFLAPNNYRSDCSAMDLMNLERTNNETDRTDHALFLYGAGDGGGGPSRIYIEKLRRVRDLEDMPKVEFEFARDFFKKSEASSRDLQTWRGELYLELHRGTLTTQALTKQYNRHLEHLLRKVEWLYSVYAMDIYPQEILALCWKTLLLNQFHDIIPGTSITRVHQESLAQYRLVEDQLQHLIGQLPYEDSPSLYNSLNWGREEVICLPESSGQRQGQQTMQGWLHLAKVSPIGHTPLLEAVLVKPPTNVLNVSRDWLENDVLLIQWNQDGQIERIFDKQAQREVIPEDHTANVFQLYEDKPNLWDAWDIDIFYEEMAPTHPVLQRVEVVESGPIRAGLVFHFADQHYTIVQTVTLCAGSRRIDFKTKIDWNESEKMLRVDFPVNVQSDKATFEIQYGHLQRPTHYNTSWDMAQFEVVAHKWCDLSQPNYGVALLNDCKYGHKVKGNTISLNLLRSPKVPDPEADMHAHEFTYSLLPHQGDHIAGHVVREAYQLNHPIEVLPALGRSGPLLTMAQDSIIVEAIKKEEHGEGLIVRLYESHGIDVKGTIAFHGDHARCELVNLMERPIRLLDMVDGSISLDFRPFEIHTLKFTH